MPVWSAKPSRVRFPHRADIFLSSPPTLRDLDTRRMVAMSTSSQYAAAQRFIKFVNASPTPYHAVRNAAVRLEKAGFSKLLETEANWDAALKNGGRFYYTR